MGVRAGITGLVPDYILENEPGYQVLCCFTIQATGVDFPPEEPSLMGDVAVCYTHNPVHNHGDRGPGKRQMHRVVKEIGSMTLISWDGKCWSQGIGPHYL